MSTGQRRLFGLLLVLGLVMVASSALLFTTHPGGAELAALYQVVLLAHIGTGLLLVVPLALFVSAHLRRALRIANPGARASGVILAGLAIVLALSGLTITTQANSLAYRWVLRTHQIGALLLVVFFLGHRFSARRRPAPRALILGCTAVLALYAVLAVGVKLSSGGGGRAALEAVAALGPSSSGGADPFHPFAPAGAVGADSPFHPSPLTTSSGARAPAAVVTAGEEEQAASAAADLERYGFALRQRVGAASCARCHPDVAEQWAVSAHRFSSMNNPFYSVALEALRARHGKARSQWCGGCHDPALLLPGAMLAPIDHGSAPAQAGLTCLACHAIERIHNLAGNGNYLLRVENRSPYLFASSRGGIGRFLHERLLRAKPEVHKRRMLQPFFRTSEYCASCHKVSLDVPVNSYRWLRGQDEYDAWQDSGVSRSSPRTFYLPERARTCQDCHMPREPAPLGDLAARGGTVRSHRFTGPNTALPALRGDGDGVRRSEAFLRAGRLRVDVFALVRPGAEAILAIDHAQPVLVPGESVIFEVVVRNLGVGHTFPGGTSDSNEAWLDVEVLDLSGREIFRSGALGADGRVDPDAHFFRSVFLDESGRRANRRNPQDFRTLVFSNLIGPGSAELVRYQVRVPERADLESVRVRATLRWRKFNRDYTEFVFTTLGRAVPDLPVTELARDEVVLAVGAHPAVTAGAPAAWTRYNDHAIALLRQGDTARAAASFAKVVEVAPHLPDGYRNLARVALREGALEPALAYLRQAEQRAPGDPQNAFFFGRAFRAAGRFERAEEAFRACLEAFPRDRGTWKELGTIRFQSGDFASALEAFQRALEIDPEDVDAHFHRMKIYEALARPHEAASARAAYLKYKADDNAAKRARRYLLENPQMNREAQRIHIHR